MALFGGQIGPYVTPDGRIVQMPADLAASFPGLTSQDQADLPAAPPPLPITPPQPAAPRPPPAPAAGPVASPSQVDPAQAQGAPRGPVTNPAQQTDAGPDNTTQPVTNAQLQKMGTAGAVNAELQAQDAVSAATERHGQALANQATAVGNVMTAANERAGQILEQRRQKAEANAAALQAKTDQYERDAKALADQRVDHSIDHPVLAAIGIALRGIGGAMQGKSGDDIMDPVYKAIDRKVALQMQDIERRKGMLALQKDALGMQREANRDQLADEDVYRLAALDQANRKIEEIKQKTSSDVIRQNTGLAQAALLTKRADIVGTGVQREQQRLDAETARKQAMQMHRESLGVQIRGQNLQQQQHDADRAERAQEKLDERAAQILALNTKDAEKKAKEVKEQGLVDPRTGDPLLTAAGSEKMDQADREEAAARKASTPEQAARLNEHAQLLRQSAQANDIATARDTKDREATQHALNATHELAILVKQAKEQLGSDPSAFDREKWAQFRADAAVVKARYVATLGERVSVRALEAFDDVLSIDPDSMFSRFADKGKAMTALDTLQRDASINADTMLKGSGVKAKWKPGIDSTETTFKGSTAAELGADTKPGVAGRLFYPLTSEGDLQQAAQEQAVGRTNTKGQVNSYGLDPTDNEKLRSLVDQAGAASHAKYKDIVSTLAAPITSDRPGLAMSVARLLKDSDQKLYSDVLSQIDPVKAQEIDGLLSATAQSPGKGLPQRSLSDLSDEERAQLEQQRRERGMKADRESDAIYFRRGVPPPPGRR